MAKLREDITEIKSSSEVYVFADKTTNIYKMSVDTHEKLRKENIAVYKKAPIKLEKLINLEAKSITRKLKLADRIEYLPQSSAYITLKDHKENFISDPSCRLIHSSKSELEKISKIIIEQINKRQLDILEYQQ